MNRYTPELSPRPISPGAVERATIGRAERFHSDYLVAHPEKATDSKVQLLFQDLKDGRFWGVIGYIDGWYNNNPTQYDPKETAMAQAWSHENFNTQELQTVLDIVVDTALLIPQDSARPGAYKGHTTLFSEFVAKPDSQFKDQVSDDFRRRLNNGRFWESLADSERGVNPVVNDVLVHHYSDLDVAFAPEGLNIAKRNRRGVEHWLPTIEGLSNKAIDGYASFVSDLSARKEELGIVRGRLDPIVSAYAEVVVSRIGYSYPKYPLDGKRSFAARLAEPFMQEYLAESDVVRNRIANSLSDAFIAGHEDFVQQVLKFIPNSGDMLERMDLIPELSR